MRKTAGSRSAIMECSSAALELRENKGRQKEKVEEEEWEVERRAWGRGGKGRKVEKER